MMGTRGKGHDFKRIHPAAARIVLVEGEARWIVVHIFYLIGFRNRLLVLIQYAWAYLTFQPGARIIVPRECSRFPTERVERK